MSLSDTTCKAAKSKGKPYKLPDDKGMFLLIHNNGGKYFRFDYRFEGKRKTLALGTYPDITLKQARERRDEARKQVSDGIDPGENRKAVKQSKAEASANSFEVIAREWLAKKCNDKSDRPLRLLSYAFKCIGSKNIDEIKPIDLLKCLTHIESTGSVYSAKRALRVYSNVFCYGAATARCEGDITVSLKGALSVHTKKHFAAITEPVKAGELLRAIDGYSGSFPVACALKLAPMLFQRPGELRAMEWTHIDFATKEWRYFVTKTQVQHIVPLASQVVEILQELRPLTGHGRYVFPSERTPNGSRCISENTLNGALKRLGYGKDEMTAHGFRAMARTILDEVLGFRVDFIEHQLAHAVRDPNGRAYNRTAHLEERRRMMQAWADYLDGLKAGAVIIPFNRHTI